MNKKLRSLVILIQAMVFLSLLSAHLRADTGTCGGETTTLPFTDVGTSIFFCQIAEAYFSGLTNGTSATTFSPSANVTREQMAAFMTRTQDSALRRGSRRAALNQWATPGAFLATALTPLTAAEQVASDGEDLWVSGGNVVYRVHASDGRLLGTWTGATGANGGVLVAWGRVFVTGAGTLYAIDPTQPPGNVTTLVSGLGTGAGGITSDGSSIWTANGASVFKISPDGTTVNTFSTGFSATSGVLFDGSNIWITDRSTLKKLDGSGNIVQSVTVGPGPAGFPVFDGTNIWVPNFGDLIGDSSVSVVRASTATVVATLTGNGLVRATQAAFDGQRILVTNSYSLGDASVSLWKAADLTELGFVLTGNNFPQHVAVPNGACSDGINFWVTVSGNPSGLARF